MPQNNENVYCEQLLHFTFHILHFKFLLPKPQSLLHLPTQLRQFSSFN